MPSLHPAHALVASLLLGACASQKPAVRRSVDLEPDRPQDVPQVQLSLPGSDDPDLPPPEQHRRLAAGRGVLRPPVLAWEVDVGGPVTAALTAGDTHVYAVAAGMLHALDASGELRWQAAVDAAGGVTQGPDGPLVGARDGALLALSPVTGDVTLAWEGTGRPRGGAVPLGTGLAWLSTTGTLFLTGGAHFSPAVSAAGEPSSDGDTAWFQTLDGELWAVSVDGPRYEVTTAGPGVGAPVVGDQGLYAAWDAFNGKPGGVLCVDPADGRQRWSVTTRAVPSAGMALPDVLLVPLGDGSLLALDPATGAERWELRLGPDALSTAPLVVGRSAYVGDAGGHLYRVDLDDGGVAWTIDLGAPVTGDPVLAWGILVVGLGDGRVVALQESP